MEKQVEALALVQKLLVTVAIALCVFALQYHPPFQYSNALMTGRQAVDLHTVLRQQVADLMRTRILEPALEQVETDRALSVRDKRDLANLFSSSVLLPDVVFIQGVGWDDDARWLRVGWLPIPTTVEYLRLDHIAKFQQNLARRPQDRLEAFRAEREKQGLPQIVEPAAPKPSAAQINQPACNVDGAPAFPALPAAPAAPVSGAASAPTPAFEPPALSLNVSALSVVGQPLCVSIIDLKIEPVDLIRVGLAMLQQGPAKTVHRWMLRYDPQRSGCLISLEEFGKRSEMGLGFPLPCKKPTPIPLPFQPPLSVFEPAYLQVLGAPPAPGDRHASKPSLGVLGQGFWDEIEAAVKPLAMAERGDDPGNSFTAAGTPIPSSALGTVGPLLVAGLLLYMLALTAAVKRFWSNAAALRTAERQAAALAWFDWFTWRWSTAPVTLATLVALPAVCVYQTMHVTEIAIDSLGPRFGAGAVVALGLWLVGYGHWTGRVIRSSVLAPADSSSKRAAKPL